MSIEKQPEYLFETYLPEDSCMDNQLHVPGLIAALKEIGREDLSRELENYNDPRRFHIYLQALGYLRAAKVWGDFYPEKDASENFDPEKCAQFNRRDFNFSDVEAAQIAKEEKEAKQAHKEQKLAFERQKKAFQKRYASYYERLGAQKKYIPGKEFDLEGIFIEALKQDGINLQKHFDIDHKGSIKLSFSKTDLENYAKLLESLGYVAAANFVKFISYNSRDFLTKEQELELFEHNQEVYIDTFDLYAKGGISKVEKERFESLVEKIKEDITRQLDLEKYVKPKSGIRKFFSRIFKK